MHFPGKWKHNILFNLKSRISIAAMPNEKRGTITDCAHFSYKNKQQKELMLQTKLNEITFMTRWTTGKKTLALLDVILITDAAVTNIHTRYRWQHFFWCFINKWNTSVHFKVHGEYPTLINHLQMSSSILIQNLDLPRWP